jgi:hypothetical protein
MAWAMSVSGIAAPQGSAESHAAQFAWLALLCALMSGVQFGARIPAASPDARKKGRPAPRAAREMSAPYDAVHGVQPTAEGRLGVLLTRTAITSWFDEMHGELWLFDDGLLRIPMGLVKTVGFVGLFFRPFPLRTRRFSDAQLARLRARRAAVWLDRWDIRDAVLRHVRFWSTDELLATRQGGKRIRLLWASRDGAFDALQPPLRLWLGEHLRVDGQSASTSTTSPQDEEEGTKLRGETAT